MLHMVVEDEFETREWARLLPSAVDVLGRGHLEQLLSAAGNGRVGELKRLIEDVPSHERETALF